MSSTSENKKSVARAHLCHLASHLPDQKAVSGYTSAIMAGDERIMDHTCDILDAITMLSEEFAAWHEGHTIHHPDKCTARRVLAITSDLFNKPTPELAHDEINNMLDLYTNLYLNGNDRDTKELICCLIKAIYTLRDDLTGWEQAS